MDPIQMAEIRKLANELRAQEMQRIAHLVAAAVRSGWVVVSERVRHLFSWHPHHMKHTGTV